MKNTTLKASCATRPAPLQSFLVEGCSPRPEDAPHYVELGHTVRTATQLEQRYNTAEWTVTRRRTGVPSATVEGYGIFIELRFTDGNGQLKDITIALCGDDDEGDGSDLSTADFRRLVAALNAAAAMLPPVPGLLTEQRAS